MRCNCCDKALSDKEIVWNDDLQSFELCSECLEIALDAAYSGDFQRPDDDEFVLLDDLDNSGDASDIVVRWSEEDEI